MSSISWCVLETDDSSHSIGTVLSQEGKPIGFYSHKLSITESKWSAIEQEAFAIVRAVDHFRHFIMGRHFKLLTDQKGVAYLFDSRPKNKIKISKLNRWRMELTVFNFEISYRSGASNVAADALSRISALINLAGFDLERATLIHENMALFVSHNISVQNFISRTPMLLPQNALKKC